VFIQTAPLAEAAADVLGSLIHLQEFASIQLFRHKIVSPMSYIEGHLGCELYTFWMMHNVGMWRLIHYSRFGMKGRFPLRGSFGRDEAATTVSRARI
jgi:hypothetical protein